MHILLLLNIIYFIIISFKIFMNKKFNLLYRFLIFFYRTFQVSLPALGFAKLSGPEFASLGDKASYSPRQNWLINLAACRGVPSEFLFITAEIFRSRRRGDRNISLDGRRMVPCAKVSFD